jgi:hypothetical protein
VGVWKWKRVVGEKRRIIINNGETQSEKVMRVQPAVHQPTAPG